MSKLRPRRFIREQISNGDYDEVIYNIYVKGRIIKIDSKFEKLNPRELTSHSEGGMSILHAYSYEKSSLPNNDLRDDFKKYYKSNQKIINLSREGSSNFINYTFHFSKIFEAKHFEIMDKIEKIIDKERAKFCCSRMNWR